MTPDFPQNWSKLTKWLPFWNRRRCENDFGKYYKNYSKEYLSKI